MLAGAAGLGSAGLMVLTMLTFVPPAAAIPKAPAAVPKAPGGAKAPVGQPCGQSDCGSRAPSCGQSDCGSRAPSCGQSDCGSRGQTCGSPDCASPDYGPADGGSPDYGSADNGRADSGAVAADCRDAIDNTAPGGSGGLKLTADVAEGAKVAPGDTITVRLTWDPKQWSDGDLDMALGCVRVKGGLDPNLSGEERPSANDGVFEFRIHVPANIKPGCDICVQGFLSGMAGDGGPQQVGSNPDCFMSGPPAKPPTTPVTQPAAPAPAPTAAPRTPAEVPAEVAGVNQTRPGTTPAPAAELPRTGGAATRVGTAGGGATLALGGLAMIGGTRRRNRRVTGI
jgi:LPXTG-motif cell wall-anchored protein